MSALRKRSSLETSCRPAASAFSAVRFCLEAIVFMPKAFPTVAERWPSLPRPRIPSVRPSRSRQIVTCQASPALSRAFSNPIRLVNSSIRPKAIPVVGLPTEPVPHTVTPRSAQALISNELLRAPVVMRSFVGQGLDHLARERGPFPHADNDLEAL